MGVEPSVLVNFSLCDVHFGKKFCDELLMSTNLEEPYRMRCRFLFHNPSPSHLPLDEMLSMDVIFQGLVPSLHWIRKTFRRRGDWFLAGKVI